jgi:hypothetical protein
MPKIGYRHYTDVLNRRPAENICHAFDFALYQGTPLNRYVVINFPAPDCDTATWMFAAIRDKFRNWYNRRTKQLYKAPLLPKYVYTLENPSGSRAHANWVVYVPESLLAEFDRKLSSWSRKVLRREPGFDLKNKSVDQNTYKTLAKYVLKGLDPLYVDYLHLKNFAEPQGRIYGRRACASASLSRASRKAAGFVARRDRDKLASAANSNADTSVA